MSNDIIGTGWAFPIGVNARGGITLARRERDIEEAIQIILLTPQGQRPYRPEFGCRIHELIFAPNDASTAGLAAYYVEQALRMWEPRIEIEKIVATPDAGNAGLLTVEILYKVRATLDRRTLVFPFYRIPEEQA